MSTEERQSTEQRPGNEPETDEHHQVIDQPEPAPPTEKPDVTDAHKETAKEMRKEYDEDRPTIAMPGTDGAVSGTAINEWVDDDGNPKFSDKSEEKGGG